MNAVERMMKEFLGEPTKTMCEYTCKNSELCNANCEHYDSSKKVYPPFTAEKQIELIQLISEATIDEENTKFAITKYGNEYYFEYNILIGDCGNTYPEYSKYGDNFSEVLADLVTSLKDKLDTAKVKEILQR